MQVLQCVTLNVCVGKLLHSAAVLSAGAWEGSWVRRALYSSMDWSLMDYWISRSMGFLWGDNVIKAAPSGLIALSLQCHDLASRSSSDVRRMLKPCFWAPSLRDWWGGGGNDPLFFASHALCDSLLQQQKSARGSAETLCEKGFESFPFRNQMEEL